MQVCSFSHTFLTRDSTNKTGSEICAYEKFKVVSLCTTRFNTKRFYVLYTERMYVFIWFSVRSVRSEWGPGLRNRIVFMLWSGRSGAEIPQGRQGPAADH